MFRYITPFVLAAIVVGLTGACDLVSVENPETNYPTIIKRLSADSLQVLNSEYHELNNNYICSTLNEFGFTGFSRVLFPGNENPCLNREVTRIEMMNQDTLVSAAKRSLFKNRRFTGVDDTTRLEIKEISPLFGCTICEGKDINSVPIEWKITFKEQKIDSLIVRNTLISVHIDANGVNRIWGNWFQDVEIPSLFNIGFAEAQQSFVGWKFDMRGYNGDENIYTVIERDLNQQPELEFYPVKTEHALEFRQAWKVPIDCSGSSFEGWYGFVDIMDGSLINILPR